MPVRVGEIVFAHKCGPNGCGEWREDAITPTQKQLDNRLTAESLCRHRYRQHLTRVADLPAAQADRSARKTRKDKTRHRNKSAGKTRKDKGKTGPGKAKPLIKKPGKGKGKGRKRRRRKRC